MAKKALLQVLTDAEIDFTDFTLISSSKSKIVFLTAGGDFVTMTGKKFDFEGGTLVDGTATGITVADNDGTIAQKLSKFSIDAGTATGDNWLQVYQSIGIQALAPGVKAIGSKFDDLALFTFIGKDIIDGRKGNDVIGGGGGNDRLTGGAGSDTFNFSTGNDKDVITDFDADGGVGAQDFIDATYPGDLAITQSGKNTVINFGDGDTLTLLGVKASQIDATDFV
jgi:Ca2+-binding RTX toxin-like protein